MFLQASIAFQCCKHAIGNYVIVIHLFRCTHPQETCPYVAKIIRRTNVFAFYDCQDLAEVTTCDENPS